MNTIPDFNLEDELSKAQQFYWETAGSEDKPKQLARRELETLVAGANTPELLDHHDE